MKAKVKILTIFMCILTLFISSNALYAQGTNSTNNSEQEFKGILIDADCSGTSDPVKHTKSCNLMPGCKDSGYGIDIKQTDGTYKFYKFDENGNKLSLEIFDKSKRENDFTVIVKGVLKDNIIKVSSIEEDLSQPVQEKVVPTEKTYRGWVSSVSNIKSVGNPTKIKKSTIIDKNSEASGYGIILTKDDGKFEFKKFDENGNKLAKEFLQSTSKDINLTVVIRGTLDDDTLKVTTLEEEQELIGIVITKSLFEKNSNPAIVKRDEIITNESEASGYGIAVPQKDGKYKFYKFDEDGSKSAKSILQWYVKFADNISNIPILVQGVVTEDAIKTSRVLRERIIPGIIASKIFAQSNKPIKDLTKADLLTADSQKSGYGYYVHSCGGHEFFKFNNDGDKIALEAIKNAKSSGNIKIDLKGFYYWVGNNIKVNSITESSVSDTPVNEEISGVIATRSYYNGAYYQENGVPGVIDKKFLLDPENVKSGYGIIYKTCCGFGFYWVDENGTDLIKKAIDSYSGDGSIKVIVQGTRDEDYFKVTRIIPENEQSVKGILICENCSKTKDPAKHSKQCTQMPECVASGYGIDVKQEDGTYKFYKFDSIGSYFHVSGQEQAKTILKNTKKENNLTVTVKGTFDGDNIFVSSITEDSN